ncbi:DUF5305 domain-containing protein [Halovenus halobia]|uniref:DUF5305 domain-containing protein n=1 Tax=Halovenus halobia TaxID=3396622 RepID=UPI003F572BE1
MRRWLGRARLFVASNADVLAVGLLLVAALGGFASYTAHADPGTEIEQRQVSSWSSTATYTHEATVQAETPVFERGETLTDRSVYLESIAPVLNGTFQYSYDASAQGALAANATLALVVRSVGENTEFWRDERTLTAQTVEGLGPNEELSVPFSVNVTEQQRRIADIEEQLGGTPGESEMVVQSTLRLTGQRNGLPVNETIQHSLSIQNSGGTYSVATDSPVSDSGQQRERVEVVAGYGPLRSVGGPVLLVAGILGLVALGVGRVAGWTAVSERERAWVEFQSDRRTFNEWVTQGTIPSEAMTARVVTVDSLEGVVDVAIDSNRRVIEDPSREIFAVMLDETTYRYEPPSRPAERDRLLTAPGTAAQTTENGEEPPDEESDTEETPQSGHSSQ